VKGTATGVQGVQFPHLELQLGGVDPIRLSAPPVNDTKLSPILLSVHDVIKDNYKTSMIL